MMFSLAIVATFAEIFSATKINITSIDDEHEEAAHTAQCTNHYRRLNCLVYCFS